MRILHVKRENNEYDVKSYDMYLLRYLKYKKLNATHETTNELSYIDFSLYDYVVLYLFDFSDVKFLYSIYQKKSFFNFKLIVCGSIFHFIDINSFASVFENIDYLFFGSGEILYTILTNPQKRVYTSFDISFDFDYYQQYSSDGIMSYYSDKYGETALISFSYNRCAWGRCNFCGVLTKMKNESAFNIEKIIKKIRNLYFKSNISSFYILDNFTTPNQMKKLLIGVSDLDNIKFQFFGIRAFEFEYNDIVEIINKMGYNPIKKVNIGVEFYSQRVLDIHNKGITLRSIDSTIDFFYNIQTEIVANIILGLPKTKKSDIKQTKDWIEKNQEKYSVGLNIFHLSDDTEIINNPSKFDIIVGEHFKLYDHVDFKGDNLFNEKMKKVDSNIYNIYYINPENGKIQSQEDLLNANYFCFSKFGEAFRLI
jgi:hypothetical protein